MSGDQVFSERAASKSVFAGGLFFMSFTRSFAHGACVLIMNVPSVRPALVLIKLSMRAEGCAESIAWVRGFKLLYFPLESCYIGKSGIDFFIASCELVSVAMVGRSELSNKESICLRSRNQICECFCCCSVIVGVYNDIC